MSRRLFALVTAGTAATALSMATVAGSASAVPPNDSPPSQNAGTGEAHRSDDLQDPLRKKQQALRQAAVDQFIKGEAETKVIDGTRVIVVEDGAQTPKQKAARGAASQKAKKRYVQYAPTEKSNIFTVLAEFGDKVDPAAEGAPGPLHNEIAKPDRTYDGTASDDNTTHWKKDFNRAHYQKMMFADSGESMRTFYQAQSSGRHYIQGDVTDWVKVPYNAARYGANDPAANNNDRAPGAFVADSLTAWFNAEKKAGKTNAQIKTYLKQFDVWDRNDFDADGDFNEADGYIDHFQAIHAGEGEEAGGGEQGADAIWSHRSAVNATTGKEGPSGNKAGGVQIGNTGIWVRDYTTEPENGGLGVFAHEYAHDLGLPDLYDTTNKASNSTSYWTLMSGGSWLNRGNPDIGSTPGYMGAWEKVQLGWADVKTLKHGNSAKKIKLGPADQDDVKKPQAVAVSLPDKEIVTEYNTPQSGEYEWWSGTGDELNHTLTQTLDLTDAKTASVSSGIWYDIETDYDYLYGQVSTDGGASWENVGDPITGVKKEWSEISFDLSAYAGKKVDFRFLYQTDPAVRGAGAFLDDIAVTIDGETTTDDVESASSDWTAAGFTRMTGTDTRIATNYYLAEYRRYSGYDETLKTGPYNFGFADRTSFVERYPYQDGLLIWYVDNEWEDNNVATHPGHGQVLPVDARPKPMKWPDGTLASVKIQSHDSTFGTKATDSFRLHKDGLSAPVKSKPAVPVFEDDNPNGYWYESNKYASTKLPASGVKIEVHNENKHGAKISVTYPSGGMLRKK